MKMTRIDRKIEKFGFVKSEENEYGASYFRKVEQQKGYYNHKVDLVHKKNGCHVLQSYDPDLFDDEHIGNTCVGLTYKELRLFLKKMKEMHLN